MAAKGRKAKGGSDPNNRVIAQNRRARHDYDIVDTWECGIALQGSEVKSLREGRVTVRDAFARVEDGEVWLHGMNIAPYAFAQSFGRHEPDRSRKLLLNRREIDDIAARTQQDSLTLVPLSLYLKNGRVKVDLALARGRHTYDKRRALAARDADREAARAMRAVSGRR